MREFVYEALPGRVVFGVGSLDQLADEVARLGVAKALVLSTPQQRAQAEDISARLGDRSVLPRQPAKKPSGLVRMPVSRLGAVRQSDWGKRLPWNLAFRLLPCRQPMPVRR